MANRLRQASSRMSWLARNSSNGVGLVFVQRPPGERKSGMAHSVEIPAPVKGAITRARSTRPCNSSIAVSRSGTIMYALPVSGAKRSRPMRYLHTMLRVRNLDSALDFYCNKLALKEARRRVDDKNRSTLVFLAAPEDEARVEESKSSGRDAPCEELTYNWDRPDYA